MNLTQEQIKAIKKKLNSSAPSLKEVIEKIKAAKQSQG